MIPYSNFHHSRRIISPTTKCFDVNRLSQPCVLSNESNKSRVDLLCDSFVAAITSAASNTIGIKSYSSSPDWFQENI